MEFNHSVTRQLHFDRADIGRLWLTTFLVFRHNLERSYVGLVANLHNVRSGWRKGAVTFQISFNTHEVKMEICKYI